MWGGGGGFDGSGHQIVSGAVNPMTERCGGGRFDHCHGIVDEYVIDGTSQHRESER
jgi:hypothetical protein